MKKGFVMMEILIFTTIVMLLFSVGVGYVVNKNQVNEEKKFLFVADQFKRLLDFHKTYNSANFTSTKVSSTNNMTLATNGLTSEFNMGVSYIFFPKTSRIYIYSLVYKTCQTTNAKGYRFTLKNSNLRSGRSEISYDSCKDPAPSFMFYNQMLL